MVTDSMGFRQVRKLKKLTQTQPCGKCCATRIRCPAMTSSALRSSASLPIRSYSAQLCKGLGLVQSRFVQQMIVGIHRTQSLHLTDIARSLGEDIALHATHKRLSRNLARKDLTGFISNALLQRAARDVTQDMMLVVNQREHFLLTFLKSCEYI